MVTRDKVIDGGCNGKPTTCYIGEHSVGGLPADGEWMGGRSKREQDLEGESGDVHR